MGLMRGFAHSLQAGWPFYPTGPWDYADAAFCPSPEAGIECYFEVATQCNRAALYTIPNIVFWERGLAPLPVPPIVSEAADLLGVSPSWIIGQLIAFLLRMKPSIAQQVAEGIPSCVPKTRFVGIHWRGAPGDLDHGRKSVPITKYVEHLEHLSHEASDSWIIYVATDMPNVTEASLQHAFPEKARFCRPVHAAMNLAVDGPLQGSSKKDHVAELLVDIWTLVQSEIFIGSSSNIFWLVYVLRQLRPHIGPSCFVQTRDLQAPLICPWHPRFHEEFPYVQRFQQNPAGISDGVPPPFQALVNELFGTQRGYSSGPTTWSWDHEAGMPSSRG
eukprot:gnl/TRDRNA2_/TRDRNA2_140682_c0_seq1.p1 gnl/TRDRNA2_/TRDRNA2_140682_c0~~gnl/TRDRNA2_/TRDRNA2_140682_c0_seq1.p1  ORF type:complete len:342 (+),score=13.15 gnl/TRDRNA2_/TRDRNA2_140682_c0_seq1:34-1026(+)